jgi:serine/threonine protein phosphatase 1
MGRTLVIGDIHGGLRALKQVLERSAYKPDKDELIFLGDLCDAWSEAFETVEYIINLSKNGTVRCIMGNHDQLLRDYFTKGKKHAKWLKHGGKITLESYSKVDEVKTKEHLLFLETMVSYYLDSKNRLFVHGGFTNLHGVHQEWFEKMFYWDRTLWELACATAEDLAMNEPHYPVRLKLYKEVFIGHTPTLRLGKHLPMSRHNIWNLDTGGGFNQGKLTIMDVETKSFWQSDFLSELYPEEQGREI